MEGSCPRCTIDNTSVIVAHGSGPDAQIAPEMEHFGLIFGVQLSPMPWAIKPKAGVERSFLYVENNFLPGRTFTDWARLKRPGKSMVHPGGQQEDKEIPRHESGGGLHHGKTLPPDPSSLHPAVYQTLYRVVDVEAMSTSIPIATASRSASSEKRWSP